MLDKNLLDILVCPKCQGDLLYKQTEQQLVCEQCKLAYPIKDSIPVLLVEDAVDLK